MQCSRRQLVEILRRTRYPDLVDAALKGLPDPVDLDEAAKFLEPYGTTRDVLISRLGGSP